MKIDKLNQLSNQELSEIKGGSWLGDALGLSEMPYPMHGNGLGSM